MTTEEMERTADDKGYAAGWIDRAVCRIHEVIFAMESAADFDDDCKAIAEDLDKLKGRMKAKAQYLRDEAIELSERGQDHVSRMAG